MVSAIWKASSAGDVENLSQLLKDATPVEIEVKDHTGITALIEAVRNGHVEAVRALLDHGADPTNSSSQGIPATYTSDENILQLLNSKMPPAPPAAMPHYEHAYNQQQPPAEHSYYGPPPPPGAYYYPAVPQGVMPPQENAVYYPPPPANIEQHHPGGDAQNQLPPPDIARTIPCRFYPACRFGAGCLFAHPQGPFFQGPLPPPAQYPVHYDQMQSPPGFAPNYYPAPPPSFIPPNMVPMTPNSPSVHPGMVQGRPNSDAVSTHHGPFSPPYVMPPGNFHPGQPPVPMSIPLLPPPQQAPMYPNPPSGQPPFMVRQDRNGQYPPANGPYSGPHPGSKSPQLQPQSEQYAPNQGFRDAHHRRGSFRRGSFSSRRPPCLFFPAGKCKNGDECRYPHVLPDASAPQAYFARGGAPRPFRTHINNGTNDGFPTIDEKLAGLSLRDNTHGHAGWDNPNRPRGPPGFRPNHAPVNGFADKKSAFRQRVPNADEFPSLNGDTATSPARSPKTNGWALPNGSGPVLSAAQVLQAPPPPRRESAKDLDPIQSDKPTNHDQSDTLKPVSFPTLTNGITKEGNSISA